MTKQIITKRGIPNNWKNKIFVIKETKMKDLKTYKIKNKSPEATNHHYMTYVMKTWTRNGNRTKRTFKIFGNSG